MTPSVERCRRYRRRILEISQQVSAAHVAPAFSCVEIVDVLYHGIMRPQDIFIMSKGHGCLAQYVVLEDLGIMPTEALDLYCKSQEEGPYTFPRLGAHPDYAPGVGIQASTGSLGHGLGIAAGQALAERLRGTDARVYVLLSDGECQEGSTWEAAMVAANLRLDNLTALVDANDFNGMDRMSEAYPGATWLSLSRKFRAFDWGNNSVVDGHSASLLTTALDPAVERAPSAIVCRTTKGRGVSFMEGSPIWHYRSPSAEEYQRALEEIG